MKSTGMIITCLAACILCGCSPGTDQQQGLTSEGTLRFGKEENPSRLERIDYDWEKYRITVGFHRQNRDSSWIMTIRDSWTVEDQALGNEEKLWDVKQCRLSAEECLEVLDRSLSAFFAEKPGAQLDSFHLELQVVKELWSEVLGGLRIALERNYSKKPHSRFDTPDEVGSETLRVLTNSPTISATVALLRKHGLNTGGASPSAIKFRDSLDGRAWHEIASLSDVGVLYPGMVEISFDPRLGSEK